MSFSDYLKTHFATARWPGVFGICAGLLLAPALSLLKPRIGLLGMGAALGAVVAFICLFGGLYVTTRAIAYYAGKRREVKPDANSWTAGLTYIGIWATPVLLIALIAEAFAAPHGWLAEFVTPLQEEQQRWFASSEPTTPQPGVDEPNTNEREPSTDSTVSALEPSTPDDGLSGADFLPSTPPEANPFAPEAPASEASAPEENPFQLESDPTAAEDAGQSGESPFVEENPFQPENEP